jgi:hypothetical protein
VLVMLAATLVAIEAMAVQADQEVGMPGPSVELPRSSIAAVLLRRGELSLTPAQVKDLERRDEALQREQGDIRERFGAPAGGRSAKSPLSFKVPGSGGGRSPSGSAGTAPVDGSGGGQVGPGTVPGGAAGGRGGHGKGTPSSRSNADDPKARAAHLAEELDNADTRAWLEAAAKLPPQLQEKATAVAERYREDLAEQRERSGR